MGKASDQVLAKMRDLAAAGLLEVQGRRIVVPDMERLRQGAQ